MAVEDNRAYKVEVGNFDTLKEGSSSAWASFASCSGPCCCCSSSFYFFHLSLGRVSKYATSHGLSK